LLPDDDDGRDSVFIMLQHLAMLADARLRIADWLRRCAPWLPEIEAEALAESAMMRPRRWKADTLAERLNLTDAERSFLEIRTIGAVDCTKEQREIRRREQNSLAQKARRQAAGAKPRGEAASRTKPWVVEGISRRTWYRRVAQIRQQYITGAVTADEPVPFPHAPLEPRTADLSATNRPTKLPECPSF
jgi:hypothetical protein